MAKTVGKASDRDKKSPPPPIKTLDDRDTREATAEDAPTTAAVPADLVVEATDTGYYEHARRRPGDRFRLQRAEDFSGRWMRWAPKGAQQTAPTLGNAVIRGKHDETLALRQPSERAPHAGLDQAEEANPFRDD
jgi:hypothetical protein